MSKNIGVLSKWLPADILEYEEFFNSCRNLETVSFSLIYRCNGLLNNLKLKQCSKFNHPLINENELQITEIEDITSTIETVVNNFNVIFPQIKSEQVHDFIGNKMRMWQKILWLIKTKICYFVQEIVSEIAHLFIYYGERLLILTLRISVSYNSLLDLDKKHKITSDISICNNTCPYLMFPLRKISVTRLLQIIAFNRAELCCHKLIDCLLETYKLYDNSDEDNCSDNSSLEIYMTLTKHMSPPEVNETTDLKDTPENVDSSTFANLEELIFYEEKNVIDLLTVIVKSAPVLLGNDCVKKSKNSGVPKISAKAREKVLGYYEEILWGEVGNYLEHIVLWWAACPLSARPPHSSQHLREWIVQFIPTAEVPAVVLSSLASLADALGVHVTSTSWDQNFRLALVASRTTCNPNTGQLFSNVLKELVMLCNQCESTPDWIIGAPLDELPLVEQIPVLHRLDHSVHTTRLWALNECKKIANTWNVKAFFALTQGDIVDCLNQLGNLRTADHSVDIEKGGLGVHVEVCTLMRAKLVSEVNENVQKLKDTPRECVVGLASVCRTICLANLKMIFPPNSYWKQIGNGVIPESPSPFVNKYLNQILVPVLQATDDHLITNMILTLICESWLDHIYMNKIKFSQYGACQLLCDFGYIATWLVDCESVGEAVRKKLLKNEVLRRCEGVGRLLLRCPGEKLKMVDKNKRRTSNGDQSSDGDGKNDLMPAEMYVPNQEQWLELRATKKKGMFLPPVCCTKQP